MASPRAIVFYLRGYSLVEMVIAVIVVMLGSAGIISLLSFNHLQNMLEQERNAAHQLVLEEMEQFRSTLYTHLQGSSREVTVWDAGTPDVADDTLGTMEVQMRDAISGAVLASAPIPAKQLQVEVTLTWHPRGRLSGKTYRESVMTHLTP